VCAALGECNLLWTVVVSEHEDVLQHEFDFMSLSRRVIENEYLGLNNGMVSDTCNAVDA